MCDVDMLEELYDLADRYFRNGERVADIRIWYDECVVSVEVSAYGPYLSLSQLESITKMLREFQNLANERFEVEMNIRYVRDDGVFLILSFLGGKMGQYFIFVNVDKKEYIEPRGGWKLWEICANGAGILPYLLADGEKDGTGLLRAVSNDEEKQALLQNGWKISAERKGYWLLEMDTKYFGRWSGDRIVVAGDYGNTKLYDLIREKGDKLGWKNITEDAYKEFHRFLGYEPSTEAINPDLVIWGRGAVKSPKIL